MILGGTAPESVLSSSRFVTVIRTLPRLVRGSLLYRWLNVNLDSAVIVIDLRETYIVGPLLRVIDELNERIRPHWERSRLQSIVYSAGSQIKRFGETRVGELVLGVLEPPEPIDDEAIVNATNGHDRNSKENEQIGASDSE
ncbi:hypothetical protein RYH80_07080 [Halobaculum sp. MBLA0147]|uniref:hypothetical protein n=1 Tax=Halobaculum sp. MBLA0147 TaxID=3079934 RepID=UPI0035262EEF